MRCMVEVVKNKLFYPNETFISCQLHDLMHDLCVLKAEEEGFYRRIDNSLYQRRNPSFIDKSVTRLAITASANVATLRSHLTHELENKRSILIMGTPFVGQRLHLDDNTICFDKSRYLRILLLEGLGYHYEDIKLPSGMGKLIHLRYLSLLHTGVKKLPQYVGKMRYLETLDLRVINSIQVPNIIWKLKRLKHLFLSRMEVIRGDKLRLDGLEELETLEGINSECVRFESIPKLISLRKLKALVTDMSSLLIIVDHANNNQLCETYLDVHSFDFTSDEGGDVLNKVLMSRVVDLEFYDCNMSSGFQSYEQGMCGNLVSLSLSDCKFGGDAIDEFGKYPMLQKLYFSGEEVVMTEMISQPNSFPQLIDLYLNSLSLEKWEVQERAFPKLQKLTISRCVNLENVPHGLRFISTLRNLTINGMPKEFDARLKEGVDGKEAGQDYAIVSHIPFFHLFSY